MSLGMTVVSLHALHSADANRSTSTPHGVATAHFGELRRPLLEFIEGSEVVVGCVAWITERYILESLARRPVALVVQKERWWKKTDARGQALARRYAALRGGLNAAMFPAPLGVKTFRGKEVPNDVNLAPIACVGYGSGAQNQPLMHHKFIVRCTVAEDGILSPVAVWSGSFNFSGNANNSFENAVEIHDPAIATAYLAEFALVASVSEPMAWRLTRPNPKGLGTVFTAPPVPPKKTTTNVVTGAGRRRAGAKRKTGVPTRPAARKTATKKTGSKTTNAAAAKPTPIKKAAAKKASPKKAAA